MIDPVGAAPSRAEIARRVAILTLAAVVASAVLTSLATVALSGADAISQSWCQSPSIYVFLPSIFIRKSIEASIVRSCRWAA